jgi:hypothetical protein
MKITEENRMAFSGSNDYQFPGIWINNARMYMYDLLGTFN